MDVVLQRDRTCDFRVIFVCLILALVSCAKTPTGPETLPEDFWSGSVVGTCWNTGNSISSYFMLKFEQDGILEFRLSAPYLLRWEVLGAREISEDRDSLATFIESQVDKGQIFRGFNYNDVRAILKGEGRLFEVEISSAAELLYPTEQKQEVRDHHIRVGYSEGLFGGWGALKLWISPKQTDLLIYNKKATPVSFKHTPRYFSFIRDPHGFPDPRGRGKEIPVPKSWTESVVKTSTWYEGGTGLAPGTRLFFEKSRVLEIDPDPGFMLEWDISSVNEISEDRDFVADRIRDWKTLKWPYGAKFAEFILQGKGNFFEVEVDPNAKVLYPEDLTNPKEYARQKGFFTRRGSNTFRVWIWTYQKYGHTSGQMLFYRGIDHRFFGT